MERAGVYVRISSDVLGVARQETDCRRLAEQRGWPVLEVYVDNDVSAFSGKPRPAYRRMLNDIGSGRIDLVVAWHGDRLHRSPLELETFIGLIESTGCQVATVQSGELDLTTPSGRLNARVVGSFARYESEHKSKRVRRKLEENAIAGKHHGGSRPYGWQNNRVTLDLAEAANVRKAIDLLLAGNSMRATVAALNAAGAQNKHPRPSVDTPHAASCRSSRPQRRTASASGCDGRPGPVGAHRRRRHLRPAEGPVDRSCSSYDAGRRWSLPTALRYLTLRRLRRTPACREGQGIQGQGGRHLQVRHLVLRDP